MCGPPRSAELCGTGGSVIDLLDRAEDHRRGALNLSIRGPGELVGEETAILGESSPTGVGYSAGRTARVFPADDLRRYLAEHPAAMWPVAAALCERLADAEERIASAARDNADRRLARLLRDLERYGEPDYGRRGTQIPVAFSQAELACWIGTCRETVDRTFKRWKRRGIIYTRYRTIIVLDLGTLARIADIQVTRRALAQEPRGKTIA